MTVAITGLTFAAQNQGTTPNAGYVRFDGYGTYTADDFTITPEDGLGFIPSKIHLVNLTDRTEMTHFVNSGFGTSNVEGLKDVAAGTKTYAAHGFTVETDERAVVVDVTVAGPITDNDDFVIEMWA